MNYGLGPDIWLEGIFQSHGTVICFHIEKSQCHRIKFIGDCKVIHLLYL
jgi:hypothetical protein